LPLGVLADGKYTQQTVQMEPGDIVMAFSDALTEVKAPDGTEFTAERFLGLANATAAVLKSPMSLHDFCEKVLDGVRQYHDSNEFEDDLTLLTLRRLEALHP